MAVRFFQEKVLLSLNSCKLIFVYREEEKSDGKER
jgi:hypothetical protein